MKKSFVLYADQEAVVSAMTDEQAGKLLRAVFAYALRNEIIENDDPAIKFSMIAIRAQIDRDASKYGAVCERNKKNGVLGGRPQKTQDNPEEPKKPTGFLNNPEEPKKPDNDTDNDLDNDLKTRVILNTDERTPVHTEENERKGLPASDAPPSSQELSLLTDSPVPMGKEYSGYTIYHAEGEMRINQRDFDRWQLAYPNLDLKAELQALSDWTRSERPWTKKTAFCACSATLRKKNEAKADNSWRKYREWAISYAEKRRAIIPDTPKPKRVDIDAGAKILAEWISPDGMTEAEMGSLISWLLAEPIRAEHVPSLSRLLDAVPGWGTMLSWASNGARGLDVGNNPHTWGQIHG